MRIYTHDPNPKDNSSIRKDTSTLKGFHSRFAALLSDQGTCVRVRATFCMEMYVYFHQLHWQTQHIDIFTLYSTTLYQTKTRLWPEGCSPGYYSYTIMFKVADSDLLCQSSW